MFLGVLLALDFWLVSSLQVAHALPFPDIRLTFDQTEDPEKVSITLQILLLFTILSLAPAIVILLTSFTRIVVVLSFLRQALGTHQMPPNQVVIGLALFLTFFIMAPVWHQVNEQALKPYFAEQVTPKEALEKGLAPIRSFMFRQTREKDLALFLKISRNKEVSRKENVPTEALIPAFVISELKTAFQIGFMIYIPFIILDMVIASVLLSMGMLMLPPIMISLPFKLMLFVLVDGWNLLVGSLVRSFY
ncbi:MAG: flagellar type III secretion system pore protein FliP [Deltaproteobacteria bacterium]|nr:flagellar type III secretion system pore protein FliP [Deltaproteobacteria bacterium]